MRLAGAFVERCHLGTLVSACGESLTRGGCSSGATPNRVPEGTDCKTINVVKQNF